MRVLCPAILHSDICGATCAIKNPLQRNTVARCLQPIPLTKMEVWWRRQALHGDGEDSFFFGLQVFLRQKTLF